MGRKLEAGDTVLCKYFNTPEGKFYGELFRGIIVEVHPQGYDEPSFTIKKDNGIYVKMARKEIKRRIS